MAPYLDQRSAISPIFESCELVLPRVGSAVTKELMVTFRPQHAKYANNVVKHLMLHFENQLSTPAEYNTMIFRRCHIQLEEDAIWHTKHKKAFVPSQMQEAITQQELLFTMAEFDFDMTKVHEDEAFKALATKANIDDISAPKVNSNASQNLSMLNSLESANDYEMETMHYFQVPNPVIPGISYATKANSSPAPVATKNPKKAAKVKKPTAKKPPPSQETTDVSTVTASTMPTESDAVRELRAEFEKKLADQAAQFQLFISQQSKTAQSDGGGLDK